MTRQSTMTKALASLLLAFVLFACAAAPSPAAAKESTGAAVDCTTLSIPVLTSPAENATISSNTITFKWNAVQYAAGYRIEIVQSSTEKTWTADVASTSYTATNLEFGHSYAWSVKALTSEPGCWDSNPSVIRHFTISSAVIKPEAPQDVSASQGRYNDRVRITWSETVRAEDYQIFRKAPNETSWRLMGTVAEAAFEDGGPLMTIGTPYTYGIKACNGAGCTSSTGTSTGWIGACSTSLPVPALASPVDFASIQYNPESGLAAVLQWDPLDSILEYQVEVYDKASSSLLVDHTVIEPHDMLTMADLGESVEFTWRVRALDPAIGCPSGSWSDFRQFRASPNPPPVLPTGLTASDGEYYHMVRLNWQHPVADDTQVIFYVFRSDTADGPKVFLGDSALTTFQDDTAVENQTYTYWVSACGIDSVCSEFSVPDTGWASATVPDLPFNPIFMPIVWR